MKILNCENFSKLWKFNFYEDIRGVDKKKLTLKLMCFSKFTSYMDLGKGHIPMNSFSDSPFELLFCSVDALKSCNKLQNKSSPWKTQASILQCLKTY